ncbi:ribosome biogenesis protein Nop53/GLTSCR2 [Gilbertella persicaria]|uniref:ribosome biogenesis protein Nop53/GLTSCR2 n=1 Tax=Gilbertella persicaria TaxID=101096 RepID=UPI002220B705|nr:ribosome biogenesis protein Nop53/GLTSCR2 [Gilbertella persicaria]KAI8090893.1 ribosome biogenesis protein Nop53/GLTSCR2 [Gilbertella persicaria]
MEIQKKKTQPSRKGKKAWRKNVDITDVEEAQEELRAIERVVGHNEQLKDEELFTIDVAGDSTVKRQLAKDKPLRVDEILAQRSAVPTVQSKNPFKKPEMTDKVASKHEYKTLKRKIENNAPIAPKKKNKAAQQKKYDLWDDAPMEEAPVNDFLPIEAKLKAPKTLNEKPVALDHIPAVQTPEGGHSYNPTVEEHQKLLAKATAVEERKAEILKQLQEQLSYREELKLLADELATSEITADDSNKKKAAERKTRQERHKSHRLATAELEKKQKLHEKAIRQQIDKLRQIEAELAERMEELDALAEKRGERRSEEEKKGVKKLGKYTVPELPVDVQLTEELCETLRQLKVRQKKKE